MSVTKPTKFPEWADGGTIVEPSGAKKTLGWVVEKPPYQFFNWLLNLIYQWLLWIDQGYVTVQTVTAAGTTTLVLGTVEVFCDTTLGNQTIQLPDVTSNDGMKVKVTKISSDANTVTVTAFTGKKISDATSQVITDQYTALSMTAYSGNMYLN